MKLKNIMLVVGLLSPALCFAARGYTKQQAAQASQQAAQARQQAAQASQQAAEVKMATDRAAAAAEMAANKAAYHAQATKAKEEELADLQAAEATPEDEEKVTSQAMSPWTKAAIATAGAAAVGGAAYAADQRYYQGRGTQAAMNLARRVYPGKSQEQVQDMTAARAEGMLSKTPEAPVTVTTGKSQEQVEDMTAARAEGILPEAPKTPEVPEAPVPVTRGYLGQAYDRTAGALRSTGDYLGSTRVGQYTGKLVEEAALKGARLQQLIVENPGTAAGIAAATVAFGVAAVYATKYLKDAYAGKFYKDNKASNAQLVADMQKSVKSAQISFDNFIRKYSPVAFDVSKALSRRAILLDNIASKLKESNISSKERARYQRLFNVLNNDTTTQSIVIRHESVERMLAQFNADLIVIQKSFKSFSDNIDQLSKDFTQTGKDEMDNATENLASMLDSAEREFNSLA